MHSILSETSSYSMIRTEHKAKSGVKEAGTVSVDGSSDGQVCCHLSERAHEAVDHGSNKTVCDLRIARSRNSDRGSRSQEQTGTDRSSCDGREIK